MNRQIVQVFGLFIVLFAVLVGFTSYWSVLDAEGLADNPDNRRGLIAEQKVPRGLILARDGRTVLARSVASGRGENQRLHAHVPDRRDVLAAGRLLVHHERAAQPRAVAQR